MSCGYRIGEYIEGRETYWAWAVMALAAVLVIAASCPAQSTRPAEVTRAESLPPDALKQLVLQTVARLGDDDPQVRDLARLQVKNLPGAAYPVIRDNYRLDDLDAETQSALKYGLPTLESRYRMERIAAVDASWELAQLLDAYEKAGPHAGAWDIEARRALAAFADARPGDEEWTSAARRLALFRKVVDAGCDNPVIWTCFASCDMDRLIDRQIFDINPLGRGLLGSPTPPTEPELPHDVDPRMDDHLRAAVAAADKLPPWAHALILQKRAQFLLVSGNRGAELGKALAADHAFLPAALAAPGVPWRLQSTLAFFQFWLDREIDSQRGPEHAMELIYKPFAAAGASQAEPLRLKADILASNAVNWLEKYYRDNPAAQNGPPPGEYMKQVKDATDAIEAAYKADPDDPYIAGDAISFESSASAPREQIETWFKRGMDADPDNKEACLHMLQYLAQTEHAADDMSEFGHKCLETSNFRGGVAFMLVQAHLMLSKQAMDQGAYLRRPAAWNEIRQSFDADLRIFPDSAFDRALYAKFAVAVDDYYTANQQFEAMGDRGDMEVWGGPVAYDYYRLESARRVRFPGGAAMPTAHDQDRFAMALEAAVNPGPNQDMGDALRSVADHFPEIPVGTAGESKFTRVTLNKAGKGIDCIRFSTPKGKPTDMRWAFTYAQNKMESWYILRADGKPMNGFRNYHPARANQIIGLKGAGDGGVHQAMYQALSADSLEPGTEYICWFRFVDSAPVRFSVAINCVPPLNREPDGNELLKDLGMKWGG